LRNAKVFENDEDAFSNSWVRPKWDFKVD
jgi:hypothetical protein